MFKIKIKRKLNNYEGVKFKSGGYFYNISNPILVENEIYYTLSTNGLNISTRYPKDGLDEGFKSGAFKIIIDV